MNTNGGADAPTFGQYCYDYADTRRSEVSSDYLALLGAYTFQGRMAAETAHFCGIFDGTNTMFPDVFSKLSDGTVKFSFSQKATKICKIWLMVLTFTK